MLTPRQVIYEPTTRVSVGPCHDEYSRFNWIEISVNADGSSQKRFKSADRRPHLRRFPYEKLTHGPFRVSIPFRPLPTRHTQHNINQGSGEAADDPMTHPPTL